MEALPYKRSYSGKVVAGNFSECGFVALGIQHAMRVRLVVIFGLPSFHNMFTHYPLN
jgi:hypothetical protein